MNKEKPRRTNLGRGLSSLLGEDIDEAVDGARSEDGTRAVPVEFLQASRFQPRRHFDEAGLAELVESVRTKGILQPILVRTRADDPSRYEIVAGERRWRAAQIAQLHEVPVIVRDLNDQEALEVALVENLQRQDLSPLEEAEGFRRLMGDFEHTQEGLARVIGKSRSHVANTMRLLGLPDPIKGMLDRNELTAGHARALLGCQDPVSLARQVLSKGLNVRQTERLVQELSGKARQPAPTAPSGKDPDTLALERDLTGVLGLKVSIRFTGRGGDLTIHYDNLEQLDDILLRLNRGSVAVAKGSVFVEEDE